MADRKDLETTAQHVVSQIDATAPPETGVICIMVNRNGEGAALRANMPAEQVRQVLRALSRG